MRKFSEVNGWWIGVGMYGWRPVNEKEEWWNTKVLDLNNWVFVVLFTEERHRIIDVSYSAGSKWGCWELVEFWKCKVFKPLTIMHFKEVGEIEVKL